MPTTSLPGRLRAAAMAAPLAAALVWASGCASPLHGRPDEELRRSIAQAIGREVIEAQRSPQLGVVTREPRVPVLGLPDNILAELEQMGGPASYIGVPAPLGDSLLPGPQRVVTVTLEHAVRTAVSNNLNVQFARLAPAISQARVAAAQAAFDWVLFADTQWQHIDQPRVQTIVGGFPTGAGQDQRDILSANAGVRRRLTTGGQFSVQTGISRADVDTPGVAVFPDPAYETNIVLQVDQPLLRNFGSDAALAQVRLSRNAERDDIQEFRGELITTVTQVEEAYWTLVRSHMDLKILQRLLEAGMEAQRRLEGRPHDVTPAQLADARSSVEERRAAVLRAQNSLRRASNRLKQLMHDPTLSVGSETLVLPADDPLDAPVQFSLADAFLLAMSNRPEVARSLLSIDDTSIRLRLANNARLPLLDLRAQTRFSGLGDRTNRSYRALTEEGFVDYIISLSFEMPIGNREAEAGYEIRRLEQLQAVIAHRNTIESIALEVKQSLVDVVTFYQLIEQTRAARFAATEQVRTTLVQEELLMALTPEFTDLKLRRQQALARAEQEEIDALVQYNIALARLYAAMGTALPRNRIHFQAPDIPQLAPTNPLWPLMD